MKLAQVTISKLIDAENEVHLNNRTSFSLKREGNKKEILSIATMWMNLKDIVLIEVSHGQKDMSLICDI